MIDSFYLLTLGSYRAFYILNWIVRVASSEHHFDPIAVIFGIIQTALYVDFAWVYWTRQRVKLRNGGVVDSDDMSRGWLLSRILGRHESEHVDEERTNLDGSGENGSARPTRGGGRWGPRGVSVSADEGVLDIPQPQKTKVHPGDSKARDDEFAHILEDDGDEESEDDTIPSYEQPNGALNGVTSGEEWRDGGVK